MKVSKKDLMRTKDLPIYSATLKLVKALDDVMVAMQKDHKHTFGQDLVNKSLHMLIMVGKINRAVSNLKEREDLLMEFMDEYDIVESILKVCVEKKYISEKLYIEITPVMVSIIRQINGWLKKTQADLHNSQSLPQF